MTNSILTFKSRPAPLWCWLLLGWLLAFTASRLAAPASPQHALAELSGTADGSLSIDAAQKPSAAALPKANWPAVDPDWSFEAMSPRQLRALPEIGSKRAVQIAESRWEQGLTAVPRGLGRSERPKLDLESVPGIGAQTERLARKAAQLRRHMPPRQPTLAHPGLP